MRHLLTTPDRWLRALVLAGAVLATACGSGSSGGGTDETGADRHRVVFLAHAAETSLPGEERAALEWLRQQADVDSQFRQIADLEASQLPTDAVLWWHYAAAPELPSSSMRPEVLDEVRSHLSRGGSLLLSLFAATWVVPLGIETAPPDVVRFVNGTDFARWGPDDDRILAGFHSFWGHPLLRRFWGGTYTLTPAKARLYPVVRYTGDSWPADGRVVAVAKRAIGINPDVRVVVEYPAGDGGRGGVLTLGEGMYFSETANANRQQLELLCHDALLYLAGKLPPGPQGAAIPSTGAPTMLAERTMAGEEAAAPAPPVGEPPVEQPVAADRSELPTTLATTTYWSLPSEGIRTFTPVSTATPIPERDVAVRSAVAAARSGLALQGVADPAAPFDLYSPRALVTGRQSGRVEDLWAYPMRILRDLRFGVARSDADVEWLDEAETPIAFVAQPEGDTFRYRLGEDLAVTVHLAVPRERPGLVALLTVESSSPVHVVATWDADHAAMWPRGESHLGELQVGWDDGAHAAVWRDATGAFTAYGGFGIAPVDRVFGPAAGEVLIDADGREAATAPEPEGDTAADEATVSQPLQSPRITIAIPYDPTDDSVITFAVAGGLQPAAESREAWGTMLSDPVSVWTANANFYRQFLTDTLDIATPDPTFDEAFRWAKVGVEAFRVTTAGVGTGLVAGYASSRRAESDPWAAENDFLRRPGYAWYFGRDAVWTTFAADAYGGTGLTSEALRFLARYQDVDGKILHEMSPAWAIHYDAADSTPLFLLGLDHYIRATGDRELLRTLWPSVRRAMRFLETTDTDDDGWIENTNVGHGWIEGGKFYGAHTTFYLASLWTATLEAVERLSTWMADAEMADSVRERATVARQRLNDEFWDPEARFFYYGKRQDGGFMSIRTILPAVPMSFGLLDVAKARPLLRLFSSPEISTDWGARMAENTNPDYNPAGYHDGSVWPLFTGWTSLAEYRYHRGSSGYAHLLNNLRLVRTGNLGYVPEVMHGDRFREIGVTSHQAWSEAMAVLPAVEGMLGIRPDALQGRLRVHPHLPANWNDVVVQPVRVGQDSFKITISRNFETSRFVVERLAGNSPVQLELSLPVPRSVLVNLDRDLTTGVAIPDGEEILDHPEEKEVLVVATLTEASGTVVFRHSPYPRVLTPSSEPAADAPSSGLRVIEEEVRGGTLSLRVEGLPGRTYRLSLESPWPVATFRGVPQSHVLASGPGRATLEFVIPGGGDRYQRADLTVDFRR